MKYTRISTFSAIAPNGTEIVLDQISEKVDEKEPQCNPFRPVGMGSDREVYTNLLPSDIAYIRAHDAQHEYHVMNKEDFEKPMRTIDEN